MHGGSSWVCEAESAEASNRWVLTATITVRDVIQDTEELRAVTLVNLARDSDDLWLRLRLPISNG